MNTGCDGFRTELEAAGAGAAALARHAHLETCAPCRLLLERELALDALLREAGDVSVPARLVQRILEAAQAQHTGAPAAASSTGAAIDDEGLEQLLASVPVPAVPAGLADGVLQGLRPERAPRRAPARVRRWVLAAAAALVAALALWALGPRAVVGPASDAENAPEVVDTPPDGEALDAPESDTELLAYVVERWDLLGEEDLDLWLASLDPLDEVLVQQSADELFAADEGNASTPRSH